MKWGCFYKIAHFFITLLSKIWQYKLIGIYLLLNCPLLKLSQIMKQYTIFFLGESINDLPLDELKKNFSINVLNAI